jgi:hypothetical protein
VPIDKLAHSARRARMLRQLRRILDTYRASLPAERRALFDRFELVDLARRVVGVGSVGIQAWIALFRGSGGEPLFLQVKEAQRTGDRVAIAAYLGSGDSFDHALLEFSESYAEQNLRDYGALKDAAADGRIAVEIDRDVLGL